MTELIFVDEHAPTLVDVLWRMRTVNHASQVVTRTEAGPVSATYSSIAGRVDLLCSALSQRGLGVGSRVASLAWNHQTHFELYMGVPAMGAVIHTLNLRLTPKDIAHIADEAGDQIVFVDACLLDLCATVAAQMRSRMTMVVIGAQDSRLPAGAIAYEELLDEGSSFAYPQLDERLVAGLCHTSGTTGRPKGVLYSHRAQFAHSLAAGMVDTFGLNASDRVLAVVPMFHGSSWGLPYAAALHGADLILPGERPKAPDLVALIEQQRATLVAAVPTVWSDVLTYADEEHADLSSVRLGVTGGVTSSENLIDGLQQRHGVPLVSAWGMTEIRVGSIVPLGHAGDDPRRRLSSGRLVPGLQARLVSEDGHEIPSDGTSAGELLIRGPWISSRYLTSSPDSFDGGWLRTGDIATIDAHGYIHITDRAKDLIKSGGEWISSVALEQALLTHPGVADVAVIARPDTRFTERPVACIVPADGRVPTIAALQEHLSEMARWWVPDTFAFLDEIPRTSVGKSDKKVLRQLLSHNRLVLVSARLTAETPGSGTGSSSLEAVDDIA